MNIGFNNFSSDDKIIIGEISSKACGCEIRRMMVELAEIKQSFETFLSGRAVCNTPKRLMKQITRPDGSKVFLYEFHSCGFISYIKVNSNRYETLSKYATIFDTILLLTSDLNIPENFEYRPKEVITMNLVDEIRDKSDLSFLLGEFDDDKDIFEDDKYEFNKKSPKKSNKKSCLIS